MNVEEMLRTSLHGEADTVPPISDLLDRAVGRGRHKQRVRRAAAVGGSALTIAAVVGGGLAVANLGPDNRASVTPNSTAGSPTGAGTMPWWDTWTTGRHNGPVDQTFLTAAKPMYGNESQPEDIQTWATGSMPDGTDWVLFTSPTTGHALQWLQGWNGAPDYGESRQPVDRGMTWTSFESPTLAAHNDYRLEQQWLIVVGQPDTTAISYAADGSDFTAMDVHDGIGVMKIDGYLPTGARVQLSDPSGVYATGTPYGAGPDPQASPTSGSAATTTPTASPSSGYARAQTAPASSGAPAQITPTPSPH